jgi:hypothetical protein
LNNHFKNNNDPEVKVVAKSLAYVNLFCIDHSRINLIEHVHKHKSMEYHGVQS